MLHKKFKAIINQKYFESKKQMFIRFISQHSPLENYAKHNL